MQSSYLIALAGGALIGLAATFLLLTLGRVCGIAGIWGSLLPGGDPFLVLADFRSYSDCQAKVDAAFRDKAKWARMAILNTARVGKFSSDRTIREYAKDIWKLSPVAVP